VLASGYLFTGLIVISHVLMSRLIEKARTIPSA
jgi:hypothetical protein